MIMSTVFIVEQRYNFKKDDGSLIEASCFLHVVSTLDRAIDYCNSYVEEDPEIPEEWHFAILKSQVDAPIPVLGSFLERRIHKNGNSFTP